MCIRSTALCAFLLLLALAGCEGPTGPPGPPGVAAAAFTVDFRVDAAAIEEGFAVAQFDAPEITPAVAADGVVLAYFREAGTWTALPYTYGVESEEVPAVDYTVTLGYAYEVGLLEIFYDVSLADANLIAELPDQDIKVVVMETLPGAFLDLTSYEAVSTYLELSD